MTNEIPIFIVKTYWIVTLAEPKPSPWSALDSFKIQHTLWVDQINIIMLPSSTTMFRAAFPLHYRHGRNNSQQWLSHLLSYSGTVM